MAKSHAVKRQGLIPASGFIEQQLSSARRGYGRLGGGYGFWDKEIMLGYHVESLQLYATLQEGAEGDFKQDLRQL